MTDRKTFILVNDRVRHNAVSAVMLAPPDHVVTVAARTRSLDQNAKLHALLTDLSRSPMKWAGKRRAVDEWKAIIISGHAVATQHGGEVIPGIEGEFVAIRESSASMSVARAASLIEYLLAFCVTHDVELKETYRGGFLEAGARAAGARAA